MYLSKLEIIGFKSFADKTTLTFNSGLSSIVGPNGSGKTNFVDALRWVLGEQKTSILRSESMDNVIFNGSKNRKPLGFAEVSITIENTKHILPSEYNEINITRRIYRDGESQYLLNKVPARLKDIVNLFMDTGLGADSYSVIELKMIEDILSGNPGDRRQIFEEAAGIKKFKQNKKEATKKLQNVELDIERLNDILSEVQKNVNSLARQAAKTKRYNTLIAELKDLELRLYAFELLSNKLKVNTKLELNHTLKQKVSTLETEVNENEVFLNDLKAKFAQIDEEYQTTVKTEIDLNNRLAEINNSISLNEEKVKSLENLQNNIFQEIEDSKNHLKRNENNFERLSDEIKQTKENFQQVQEDLNKIIESNKSIINDFKNKQAIVQNISSVINDLKNKLSYHNSIIERNAQNVNRINIRIEDEKRKYIALTPQIIEIQKEIGNKKNEFEEKSAKLKELQIKLKNILEEKANYEKQMEELRESEFAEKSTLTKKIAEKNFLESIVINDETTKYLLKSNKWKANEDKILLGEIIEIDEKYKKALNIALDSAISSFLINDFEDANSAIKELKETKKGNASFLISNNKAQRKNKAEDIKNDGVIDWLSNLITIKSEYKDLIENLTNSILLVNDFETAKNLFENNANIAQIVTLDGELITSNGIIRGGGEAASQKSQIIGRRNKINALNNEIQALENKITEIQNSFKQLQKIIWNYEIPDKENAIKNLEKQISDIEKQINQFELKFESLKNNQKAVEEVIQQLIKDKAEFSEEDASFSQIIEELKQQIQEAQNEFNFENAELEELRSEVDKRNNIAKQEEIEIVKIQSDLRYKESELQKVRNSIENTNRRIKDKQIELQNNKVTKEHILEQIENSIINKEKLINDSEDIHHKKEIIAQNRKSIQEQLHNYEIALENRRKNYQSLQNELHSLEIEITGLQTKIESVKELTLDQYQISLEEYIESNEIQIEQFQDYNIQTAKTDIALMREKISALGNVNFQALEDYEEQKKRLDFLLTQLNDLTNSKKTLNETIDEINKVAIEKFITTFEQIRKNFSEMFKVLFGQEGEADLSLEGDSPLDASIYISAKPPYKKPSSIDLLSAGEKTLTAIALLFSIYLVKPSPFCVLDEVDAPLDDSNIDRFINLVRKFSQERDIQFILITHNKRTMEAAETLYGLTMQEEGVSKVVSVKLEK